MTTLISMSIGGAFTCRERSLRRTYSLQKIFEVRGFPERISIRTNLQAPQVEIVESASSRDGDTKIQCLYPLTMMRAKTLPLGPADVEYIACGCYHHRGYTIADGSSEVQHNIIAGKYRGSET